jgi:AraC family transcriptional activator of mtrCDE
MTKPQPDDALSGLAPLLRVRPELTELCRFGGAWASPHGAEPAGWAYFHMVTEGRVQLDRPGFDPLMLDAGDILLLPQGDAHTVRAPGPPGPKAPQVATDHRASLRVKRSIGVEPDAELICGRLHFESASRDLVLAALPDAVVLRTGEHPLASRFHPILYGIRDELDGGRPGALAIAGDLASALFMMLLRAHLEESAPAEGLLQLLGHRATARAVLAMVHDPGRAWTLEELARTAVASRATLVRAFRKAAGMAPLAFLADLRLGLARRRLGDRAASLDEIAAQAGYQSQAAFSRAFLRKYGVRPGKLRPAGRASAADR